MTVVVVVVWFRHSEPAGQHPPPVKEGHSKEPGKHLGLSEAVALQLAELAL